MPDKPLAVVTGASGFIAKHVVLRLLESGYRVRGTLRGLDRQDEVRTAVKAAFDAGKAEDGDLSFAKADLTADAGWSEAMAGSEIVLHTASPFPFNSPKNEDDLIRPAVEGTARVLNAAADGGVMRAVVTSSAASVLYGRPEKRHFDASDWTDLQGPGITPYTRSKTLAEREAWEVAEHRGLRLNAVNPTLVLGPPLDSHFGTSLSIVGRLLNGAIPAIPRAGFGVVDVRDVADLHVAAAAEAASSGNRYLASSDYLLLPELAEVLVRHFSDAKRRPVLPDWIAKLLGRFSKDAEQFSVTVGKKIEIDTGASAALIGHGFKTAEEAIVAAGEAVRREKI